MLITISFQDAVATPAMKRYAQKTSVELERYFGELLSADWHFLAERQRCVVKLQLHARRRYYRAAGQADNFRAAMDQAAEKLRGQQGRRKDILRKLRRRTGGVAAPA